MKRGNLDPFEKAACIFLVGVMLLCIARGIIVSSSTL